MNTQKTHLSRRAHLPFLAAFLAFHILNTSSWAAEVDVPRAAVGPTPKIEVDENGNVVLDFVQRSLVQGVPKYLGPMTLTGPTDQFLFKIGEFSGKLALIEQLGTTGTYLYRPRSEGSFLKFYYFRKDNAWRVHAQSGAVWNLGSSVNSRDEAGGKTLLWSVTQLRDSNNNAIRYSYLPQTDAAALAGPKIDQIGYNHYGTPAEAFSVIDFAWTSGGITPRKLTYASGYRRLHDAMTLDTVTVRAIGYDESGQKTEDKRITTLEYETHQANCADKVTCTFRGKLKRVSVDADTRYLEYDYYPEPHKLDPTKVDSIQPVEHSAGKAWIVAKYNAHRNANPATKEKLEQWLKSSDLATLSQTYTTSVGLDANKNILSWIQTTHKLVDMDGDGDMDMLVANKFGWFWRKNNNGKWSYSDYQPVTFGYQPGDPAFLDPDFLTWGRQDAQLVQSAPMRYEISSTIQQDVRDITGDGMVDLLVIWSSNRTLYVSRGNGTGFDRPEPWWVFPNDVPLSLNAIDTRPIKTKKIGLLSEQTDETIRIIDLNGDNLPDYVRVRESDELYYWDLYLNTGSGFASTPRVILKSENYAALKSSRRIGYAVVTLQDLLDLNGDRVPDMLIAQDPDDPETVFKIGDHNTLTLDQGFKNNKLAVHWGTGAGFDFIAPGNLSRHSGMDRIETRMLSASNKEFRDHTGFHDVNGDGLLDYLVAVDFNYIRHIDPSLNRIDPAWQAEVTSAENTGDSTLSATYNKSRIYVYYNKGAGEFSQAEIFLDLQSSGFDRNEFPTSLSAGDWVSSDHVIASYATVRQSILDFNGDGQMEFVNTYSDWQENYNKPKSIAIDPINGVDATFESNTYDPKILGQWLLVGPAPRPLGRLKRVKASNGHVVDLEYSLGTDNNRKLPFPIWALSRVVSTDPVTRATRALEMASHFPVFDVIDREFRGFETLEVTKIDTANTANNRYSVHRYRTGRYDQGLEYQTSVYSSQGAGTQQLMLRVDRSFESLHLKSHFDESGGINAPNNANSSRVWVRPLEITIFRDDSDGYNNPAQQYQRRFSYQYWGGSEDDRRFEGNELGLVRRLIDEGDPNESEQHRITTIDYDWIDTNSAYSVRTRSQRLENLAGSKFREVKYSYDGRWNLTRETELISLNPIAFAETNYLDYDTYGRPGKVINPDGSSTYYDYYANLPYLSKIYQRDSMNQEHALSFKDYDDFFGKPRLVGGPAYEISEVGAKAYESSYFEYDALGRIIREYNSIELGENMSKHMALVREVDYSDTSSSNSTPYIHTKVYPQGKSNPNSELVEHRRYIDTFGQEILGVNSHPDGWVKNYAGYNSFGELVALHEPFIDDDNELLISEQSKSKAIEFYYDNLGRPLKVHNLSGHASRLEYNGRLIHYYDEIDNIAGQPSASFSLNGFDEITTTSSNLAQGPVQSTYSYHPITGDLDSVTDQDHGIFQYKHFPSGLLRSVVLPGAQAWAYEYTAAGALKRVKRSDNSTTEFTHDDLGRLQSTVVRDGQGALTAHTELTFYQDTRQLGRPKSISDGKYTLNFNYGPELKATTETLVDHDSGTPLSLAYEHDLQGNVTSVTYPDRRKLRLSYDSTGNLAEISDNMNPTSVFAKSTYNADNSLKSVTGYVNSASGKLSFKRNYLYDANHLLAKVVSSIGQHQWATEITYWQDGNVKSYETTTDFGMTNSYGFSYSYDKLNRLTRARTNGISALMNSYEFTYNNNGTINTANEDGNVWEYQYVDTKHHTLKKMSVLGQNEYFVFDYDNMGQRSKDTYEKSSATASSDTQRIYDWTPDGKLSLASEFSGGIVKSKVESKYAFSGERWKKIIQSGGVQKEYLRLNGLLESERTKRAVSTTPPKSLEHYYVPIGDLEVILSSDGSRIVQFEERDGVSYVFSGDDSLLSAHAYSPYGRDITLGGSQPTKARYGYSEKERDGSLLFYGARNYDPQSRQFLSIDALSKVGLNVENYLLGASSPTNHIDVDGMDYYDSIYKHHYIGKSGPAFGADHYGPWSGVSGGAYVGSHDWFGSSNFHWVTGNRNVDGVLGVAFRGLNALVNTAGFIINVIPNSANKIAVATRDYQGELVLVNVAASAYQAYVTGGGNVAQLQAMGSRLANSARRHSASLWNSVRRTSKSAQGFGSRYNTGPGEIGKINCGFCTAASSSEIPATSSSIARVYGLTEGPLARIRHVQRLFRRLGLGNGRYRTFNSVADARRYMKTFPLGYKFGVAYQGPHIGHAISGKHSRFGFFFRDFQSFFALPRRSPPGADRPETLIHIFPFHPTR